MAVFAQGHALVVGVGRYLNLRGSNVPVAATDAKAVAKTLQDGAVCGYPEKQVRVMVDEEATRELLLGALDELGKKLQKTDTLFFFYCGHGAQGTDGKYYLVSHDAQYLKGVVPGTGISAGELIEKLREINASRVFIALNTCYSGNVSPTLALDQEPPDVEGSAPPADAAAAILATGSGRIIITAAREDQKSYIGRGERSYFTQALIDGLRGTGVANKNGYIGAFNLYESIYDSVSEVVQEKEKRTQQPELTVLKGVGPFPVSLYKGATSLGLFDEQEQAPALDTVRQVSQQRAEKLLANFVTVTTTTINTGGGANIGGNVTVTNGDFTGRDRITNDDHSTHDDHSFRLLDFGQNNQFRDLKFGDLAAGNIIKTINQQAAGADSQEQVLELIKQVAAQVADLKGIDEDQRDDAQYNLEKAQDAGAKGNKDSLLSRLGSAKDILVKIGAAAPVVLSIADAVGKLVQQAAKLW